MFEKLFKKPMADILDTEPDFDLDDPPTENPVASESRYVAVITVSYDRTGANTASYMAYLADIKIFDTITGHRKHIAYLNARGGKEDSCRTNAVAAAKKWIEQQEKIDNPKTFEVNL